MLAVVYRNATDIIFKIQLRKLTGVSEMEMAGKKKGQSSIGFLMDPNVALDKRNVYAKGASTGSFAQAVDMNNRSSVSAGESSPDANMS